MRTKTKNKVFNLCLSVLICVPFIFVFSISSYAESIEDILVLKISPQDERAVIKTSERRLKIIKIGDELTVQSSENKKESSKFKVTEITKGRVVFEEMTNEGLETVIIRVEDEDGSGLTKQKIERIRKTADKQPLLLKPVLDMDERR